MSDSNARDDERNVPPGTGEPAAPTVWLPPRLREKLETTEDVADDWTPKRSSPLPAILTTAVVLVVAAAGFIWWRSASQKKPGDTATAQAESIAHQTPPPPLAGTDTLASGTVPAPGATTTPGATTPAASSPPAAAKPSAPAPSATSAAATSAPAAASRATESSTSASADAVDETPAAAPSSNGYGLVVASYLFEDRANNELNRLKEATGLAGMVSPRVEGGSTTYNVILGKFGTRAAAERKGSSLVQTNVVRQAQVVARPQ